ncbi:MAG: hypothetical protein OXD35_11370, partial [Thiotrichales bacterium]|nr:hypothetical protein [Thiotrichales bacterium]
NLAELLRDYAVDASDAVGPDNPLRQVVLNTHSPEVARQLSFDDLVFLDDKVRIEFMDDFDMTEEELLGSGE